MSRQVVKTKKNIDGDITAICGYWGIGGRLECVSKTQAIHEIENNPYSYYVIHEEKRVYIKVLDIAGAECPYLTTEKDCCPNSNLEMMPDCHC